MSIGAEEYFLRRCNLFKPARIDNGKSIAYLLCLLEVVGDEDRGQTESLDDPLELKPQVFPGFNVQAVKGLI